MAVRRKLKWAGAVIFLLLVATCAGIHLRVFRAPYKDWGKRVAWFFKDPEAGFNFDTVVPHKIYRSGLPDERFLKYVMRRYGIRRLISLTGEQPVHQRARELGLDVTIFDWAASELPPREELDRMLGLLDRGGPVLFHCWAGADRSGYATAFYRVTREGWTVEQAREEMVEHWHRPGRNPELHEEMDKRLSR